MFARPKTVKNNLKMSRDASSRAMIDISLLPLPPYLRPSVRPYSPLSLPPSLPPSLRPPPSPYFSAVRPGRPYLLPSLQRPSLLPPHVSRGDRACLLPPSLPPSLRPSLHPSVRPSVRQSLPPPSPVPLCRLSRPSVSSFPPFNIRPSPLLSRRLCVSSPSNMSCCIGSRTIGHRTIGHRTIGHRTIGHRTIGHRTIGHTDDWSYGRLVIGRLVIGPTGHRSYRRWDYRRLSKAKTKKFLKHENYLLDHFTVKYVIQNTNNT